MTALLPVAQEVRRGGAVRGTDDTLALTYEDRFLRRKVLTTTSGLRVLVDLPHASSLDAGDALPLDDGRLIGVEALAEPLFSVRGPDLARLAWHIGNRHTPCQICGDHLLIQQDEVIGHMLSHLGASVTRVMAPFTPEGGAYGHGRTHAHAHGHTAHDH